MPRHFPDFVDAGMSMMSDMLAPKPFKQAVLLSVISTGLGRRTWLPNNKGMPPAWPNLYIMLVGHPGSGKDNTIGFARDLLYAARDLAHPKRVALLSGSSISTKGIVDLLDSPEAEQTFTYQGKQHSFRSIAIQIPELSITMPDHETRFVGLLNELYNCAPRLSDKIRGNEVSIENPHATVLLGNQPATLFDVFPEKVFGMGFTARICFVSSKRLSRGPIFNLDDDDDIDFDAKRKSQIHQLAIDYLDIVNITGPYKASREAKKYINDFALTRPEEVPGRKWRDYNERRPLLIQKLAMCYCASRTHRKLIELEDLKRARSFMTSYELFLPSMFDDVVSSRGYFSSVEAIEALLDGRNEITHIELANHLSRTHNIHDQRAIIQDLIVKGRLTIKLAAVGTDGKTEFHPRTYIIDKP